MSCRHKIRCLMKRGGVKGATQADIRFLKFSAHKKNKLRSNSYVTCSDDKWHGLNAIVTEINNSITHARCSAAAATLPVEADEVLTTFFVSLLAPASAARSTKRFRYTDRIQFANLPAGKDRINLHNRLCELRHFAAEYRNEKKGTKAESSAVRSLAISTGRDGCVHLCFGPRAPKSQGEPVPGVRAIRMHRACARRAILSPFPL